MAKKIMHTLSDLFGGAETQVYQEGELFVFSNNEQGWTVGHLKTNLGVCDDMHWPKKGQALDYAKRIMDYEENGVKINWDASTKQIFYQVNDANFVQRAFDACK